MMKNVLKKLISFLLVTVMLISGMPAIFAVDAGERADYSVSPSYAARYPNGVFEFTQAEAETCEGGSVHFKLIREGGTTGRVTLEIKAVDITAKYGVDYYVKAGGKKLVLDDEYSGTLTENYLDEIGFDYVTSDDITKDEEYKRIIGYKDTKLDDKTTAELYGASVGLVSDTLKISSEEAQKLLRVTEPNDETEPVKSEAEKAYASKLHEQHDAILGGKSAANHMNDTDLIDEDALFGSNDKNLAASEIYAAAVGASLVLTFEEGENEKEIVVVSIGDKEHEPQEIASLGICNPTGGAEIGALLNVAIKINDDDKATETSVGFEAPSVKVGSNENAAAVDIVRSGSLNDYAVVRVNTKSVSAEQGTDYLPVSASSVFLLSL